MLESPFNEVAGLSACNFIKKRLHRCFPVNIAKCFIKKRLHRGFPVNIAKFLKNTYFEEHL